MAAKTNAEIAIRAKNIFIRGPTFEPEPGKNPFEVLLGLYPDKDEQLQEELTKFVGELQAQKPPLEEHEIKKKLIEFTVERFTDLILGPFIFNSDLYNVNLFYAEVLQSEPITMDPVLFEDLVKETIRLYNQRVTSKEVGPLPGGLPELVVTGLPTYEYVQKPVPQSAQPSGPRKGYEIQAQQFPDRFNDLPSLNGLGYRFINPDKSGFEAYANYFVPGIEEGGKTWFYVFDAFNKFDSQGNISSQGTNSIGLIPINVRVLPLGRVNQGDTVSLSKTIGPYIQATTIIVQVASLQATKKTEKGKEIIEVNLPSAQELGEGKEFTLEAGEKREIFYDFSFSNPPIYFSDGREMYLFEQVVTKKGSETPDSTSIHAVILGADNANNPTGLWGSNILVYEQPNLPIASKEVSFNYSLFNVIETPLASIQSKAFIDSSKIFFSLFSNALGLTSFKADAREPLNSVPQSQINYHFEGVFNSEGRAAGFAFIDGYGIGVFNNAGFDSERNELRGVEYSVVFNNESFRNKNSASNSVAWNLFENFSASSIRFGGRPQD
ncbi:MAG TPA: hypothetical protein VJK05_00270, partial [archaeon]|nr:hypothetical protein [archaeon]